VADAVRTELASPASSVLAAITLMRRLFTSLLGDERGQDLAEYMMLGAFIGIVSILVWTNIVGLMGERYTEYNANVNDLWVTPELSEE